MKKVIGIVITFILIALLIQSFYPQNMNLKVGDKVPLFNLQDQHGNDFSVNELIGKKAMVIYFYPKDDTPGCTKEACSFRDEFEVFTDMDVAVIGISSDDVESHKKFAEKYNLPFTLLADINKEVRKLFGVKNSLLGILPGRVTYVIDREGIIRLIFENQFGAEQHISESIAVLKKMQE